MDDRKNDMKPREIKAAKIDKDQMVSLENRQKLTLTGVLNVESFNEMEIVLETVLGMLYIKGTSMHMNKLNLDTGDLAIGGEIDSLTFSEKKDIKTKGAGFLSKLFK